MSLNLHSVRVTFPDGDHRITALDDVTVTVRAGEMMLVTGPSGSGKSTLLAVAGALTEAGSGTVSVAGTPLAGLGRSQRDRLRRTRIGFVFQQANLLPSLTVTDQLLLIGHINGERPAASRDRARELLARVGLTAKEGRRPHQLSGGERQRVGIARALMGRPALLLVDEPTSALDHERGLQVMTMLAEVTAEQRTATVVVTHDLQYLPLADRVARMQDGRLTVEDPSRAVGRAQM
ncbi:ABC transporter ATP-binding protein [Nakamurella silvestris]|nr:ABC transporter ATP-binding protein [Nakamurella silvestris]